MNLTRMTDGNLAAALEGLVKSEFELLPKILHHLREVDRRRLFCKFGYGSLFKYVVDHLGYSEDEAYRRISAMRLLKELPQIEERIESGALALTNIAQVQTFFRNKKDVTTEAKLELLERIENCSTREVA